MRSFSLFLAFFKLWNTHLHLTPCYGDSHLGQILENFIDQYGLKIHRDNLYGNFVLHLSNLSNFDAISSSFMLEMINRYQVIFKVFDIYLSPLNPLHRRIIQGLLCSWTEHSILPISTGKFRILPYSENIVRYQNL